MRTTLLFLLVVSSLPTIAQNEYFLTGTRWEISYSCGPFPYYYYNQYYQVTGDSIINEVAYKIVSGHLNEIVRSEGTIVYRWNETMNADELMYDFSGDVGDTLEVSPGFLDGSPPVITDIDSVSINGQWRKVYYIEGSNGGSLMGPVLMEGAGSAVTGLFGPIGSWFDCSIAVTCYSTEGFSYHWNYDQTNLTDFEEVPGACAIADELSEEARKGFSCFPNPCSTRLHILSEGNPVMLVITDCMGKVVVRENNPAAIHDIDVSQLSSGIYLVSVSNEDTLMSQRIFKN